MERFARLDNWNDVGAYKDKDGNVIPEYLYFMFAIKSYYNKKERDEINSSSSNKEAPRTGKPRSDFDYERE